MLKRNTSNDNFFLMTRMKHFKAIGNIVMFMIRHFVFTDFLRISEQSLCLKGFEKVRSLFGDVERCDLCWIIWGGRSLLRDVRCERAIVLSGVWEVRSFFGMWQCDLFWE
jgi:hypothetical protein